MMVVVGAAGVCSALLRPVGVSRSLSSAGNGEGVFVMTPLGLFAVPAVAAVVGVPPASGAPTPGFEDTGSESLFAVVSELLVPAAATLCTGSFRPRCLSALEGSLVDAVADVPDGFADDAPALGDEVEAAVWRGLDPG